uniref:Non-specific serine/threonine protein kinase n=2 Tax=Haemonchus contortus TaxID=6289 RepID=A0A7I4YER4_HAECO
MTIEAYSMVTNIFNELMLNMLQFSNGRHRHSHRHSVLDLDKCGFGSNSSLHKDSPLTHYSSLSSIPSSSSLSPHSEDTSYNSRCLRSLRRSRIRITPEDVYQLRRELQADYATQRTVAERKRCLREACATLMELRNELVDEERRNDPTMPFFVFEYQAFLCWIYSTIRFSDFTSEMERHFREMKEHHRTLLSALPPRGEPFLLAVLRFSQICVEYAALCDEEALQWCRLAYARNLPRKKSSSTNTTRSASSLSSSSSSSDVDEVLARRDSERIAAMLQDLRSNISEIELGMALSIGDSTGEKLVY